MAYSPNRILESNENKRTKTTSDMDAPHEAKADQKMREFIL